MSSTPVRRDQSKIRSASGAPHTGKHESGQLGNVLPNGEDASDDGAVVGSVRRRKSSSFRGVRQEGSAPWCRPCNISAARHNRVLIRLTLSARVLGRRCKRC